MNIMKASNQWAARPADERFWDLSEMRERVDRMRTMSVEKTLPNSSLDFFHKDGEVMVKGTNHEAKLTHWAFGQLSTDAGAPASYLRRLPAALAVANIKAGLDQKWHGNTSKLLIQANGDLKIRSITSDDYARVWNIDLIDRLMGLEQQGWRVPPARPVHSTNEGGKVRIATAADAALSLTVKEGDEIGPAGLYASDEDMFAFLVDPSRIVADGTENGMMRGFMMWNSEVGKSKYGFMSFLLQGVCGNHIIWGASQVQEITVVHWGAQALDKVFKSVQVSMKKYAESSANELEAEIQYARTHYVADNKVEPIVDEIFRRLNRYGISRTRAAEAYGLAVENEEFQGTAPHSVFGMVQGLTRLSQLSVNTDTRMTIDRAAGKLMDMARSF